MGKAWTFCRGGVALAAVVFLGVGMVRTHKVYEADSDFGVLVFERISEVQLVEYATYGGVYAQNGRMLRHDWAVQQDGKQKCPT